jgi:hypothetical protein
MHVPALPLDDETGPPMSPYQFFLFRNGQVVGQTDCQRADDRAAFEVGEALCAHQTVEIYSKNRLVTRLQQADASPDIGTERLLEAALDR